jgi:hypothetical protein
MRLKKYNFKNLSNILELINILIIHLTNKL